MTVAALGLTTWITLYPNTFARSGDPGYTDAEHADAKRIACAAFAAVRKGISDNTNLPSPGGPEDVVGSLAVAANARISLFEGGQYLRARTPAATPTELAATIETFSETLMDIGAAATAGIPSTDPGQSTRLRGADTLSAEIAALCV